MPRFSIIIPVYNTEKYLEKCLLSVFSQSYDNYEIIVINDGSTDKSSKIINKYIDKINFIDIDSKKTVGPSYVRNLGISKACGDYLLFLDSDDYYDPELLNVLNKSLDDDYDFVRFEIQYDNNGVKNKIFGSDRECIFSDGISAFNQICNYSIVESPCCYLFSRKYLIDNDFKFKENTLHEDFGLIPLVLLKSTKSKVIPFVGYNYVIHSNSIMTDNSYERIIKKTNDFLCHFEYLKKESSKVNGDLSIFNSYIANSVILKATTLKGNDYKKYVNELKRNNAFEMLLNDTFGRKIKKFLIKLSPKFYYKLVRR